MLGHCNVSNPRSSNMLSLSCWLNMVFLLGQREKNLSFLLIFIYFLKQRDFCKKKKKKHMGSNVTPVFMCSTDLLIS